eukprot:3711407-Rhodomonas_salina.2
MRLVHTPAILIQFAHTVKRVHQPCQLQPRTGPRQQSRARQRVPLGAVPRWSPFRGSLRTSAVEVRSSRPS